MISTERDGTQNLQILRGLPCSHSFDERIGDEEVMDAGVHLWKSCLANVRQQEV
jgi:hypothetical protein